MRTTNAGLNWTQIDYNYSTCFLVSVRFINPTTGWILGPCSQIIKTTDGGASWFNQTSPVGNEVYFTDCFFTSALTSYIAGGPGYTGGTVGYILKTTDGGDDYSPVGIEAISNEIPNQFSLSQNYPNPFNPVTKIKFNITSNVNGQTSNVRLIVFDALGREVELLVNESLNPGNYEVEFDGSKLTSGVYFYSMSFDGNIVGRKKMFLLK